jgi:hypothetical protein
MVWGEETRGISLSQRSAITAVASFLWVRVECGARNPNPMGTVISNPDIDRYVSVHRAVTICTFATLATGESLQNGVPREDCHDREAVMGTSCASM